MSGGEEARASSGRYRRLRRDIVGPSFDAWEEAVGDVTKSALETTAGSICVSAASYGTAQTHSEQTKRVIFAV